MPNATQVPESVKMLKAELAFHWPALYMVTQAIDIQRALLITSIFFNLEAPQNGVLMSIECQRQLVAIRLLRKGLRPAEQPLAN